MDNTQGPIPEPPRAITTKDILYLKDALSWELLAFKKFHFLSRQVDNTEIRDAMDQAGKMHQKHFQKLLTHLEVDNNKALAEFSGQQSNQS
ncbi:rubrerythrin family protein [Bacillus sp. T33-2]|uniref:rubrerythrin family protein n=1 Tax=Bacillus sp. T33-2 TaxID=2054168 RepID=UPI000C76D9B9|nr:rubrerythrin family protein [Bacillus sp. T33-2]PLR94170.1 rubrerythrin family protein [Bacillus sp. T33-2]